MVFIVGAGPGAEDLITVRGLKLLQKADLVIYAGSLVNPGLLKETKPGCRILDSAKMTLEEVIEEIVQAENKGMTAGSTAQVTPSSTGRPLAVMP